MTLLNSAAGYGSLTKALHWAIAVLFGLQYTSAWVMMRTGATETTLGIGQAAYYNWHKSLGLVALALALVRLVNRRQGELPPWAPTLSPLEQRMIHTAEPLLYAAMLVMPISGFLYCMAGGYGVLLFGVWELANPLAGMGLLASVCRAVHVVAAFALLIPLGLHLGLVIGHHVLGKDGMVRRMWF
jgi:cytochrome b561